MALNNVVIQLPEPMLSIERYAERTGETVRTVQSQIDKGILPMIQPIERGKKFVNMTALLMLTLHAEENKAEHLRACWS